MNIYLIPGEVPSAKNSKRIALNRHTEKAIIIGSKASLKYKKNTAWDYIRHKKSFREELEKYTPPYYIGLFFCRRTNARFDYNNIGQAVFDQMVEYGMIDDDNANLIVPVMLGHTVNKKEPSVSITIIPSYKHIPEYIEHFYKQK